MSILKEILKYKKEELQTAKSLVPLEELKAGLKDIAQARPFKTSIKRGSDGDLKLIAELKKASPSNGRIRENFDVSGIISIYDKKNVSAISVLTEKKFFEGCLEYLGTARETTEKPLLRKDFIFDEYQVYESKANGADAILLITATLEKSQLSDLQGLAKELSLECLVEVRNLKELDTALYAGSDIIGINNRDLNTLKISLNTTLDLLKDIPDNIVVVSESGIHTREDVKAIESSRADAILVGTIIMKSRDIGEKIDEIMGRKN